jgi:hypothetical protein
MALDYVPAGIDLCRKREVLAMAKITGRSRHEIVGLCLEFWTWASNETHDGTLEGLTVVDVCEALAAPQDFFEALLQVRWLEQVHTDAHSTKVSSLFIPKFDRWMSKTAKSRLNKNIRQAAWRDGAEDVDVFVDTQPSTKGKERKGKEVSKGVNPLKPPARETVASDGLEYPDGMDTPEVRAAIDEWLEHKRSRRQSYKTAKPLEMLLEQFARDGPSIFVLSVKHSIAMNYQGVFPPKGSSNDRPRQGAGTNYDPHANITF